MFHVKQCEAPYRGFDQAAPLMDQTLRKRRVPICICGTGMAGTAESHRANCRAGTGIGESSPMSGRESSGRSSRGRCRFRNRIDHELDSWKRPGLWIPVARRETAAVAHRAILESSARIPRPRRRGSRVFRVFHVKHRDEASRRSSDRANRKAAPRAGPSALGIRFVRRQEGKSMSRKRPRSGIFIWTRRFECGARRFVLEARLWPELSEGSANRHAGKPAPEIHRARSSCASPGRFHAINACSGTGKIMNSPLEKARALERGCPARIGSPSPVSGPCRLASLAFRAFHVKHRDGANRIAA